MRVVPDEPTQEMLSAGLRACTGLIVPDAAKEIENVYKAMLAAHSPAAADGLVIAWVRFCSDGTYEGPIMDCAIDDVRKKSGAWTPLAALTSTRAEGMEGWIAVSDRVPIARVKVLFVNNYNGTPTVCVGYKGDDFAEGRLWFDEGHVDRDGDFIDIYDVTHWQPLPDPPAIRRGE